MKTPTKRIALPLAALAAGALLFLFGAAAGCRTAGDAGGMPDRERSAWLTTEQAGFMILQHPGEQHPEIRYRLRLSPNREVAQPLLLQATFENPENPGRPIVGRQQIEPGVPSFELESRPLWGLRQDRVYHVVIEIYDPGGNRLGVHRQGVFSTIDTRYPDLGRGR